MELPCLKLAIVHGPRAGETLEFKPGSRIRIGRVVRGNNVTIKDDGISSKHLVIESESGKWTIQDLDSSNGTFLNSSLVPPGNPVDLRDGDAVKIGDCTTISLEIITMYGVDDSVAKRNTRRQANVPGTASVMVTRGRKKAEVQAEPSEISRFVGGKVEDQSKTTINGRGRRKNLQEMPRSIVEIQSKVEVNLEPAGGDIEESKIPKRGRGRKKKVTEIPLERGKVQTEGKQDLKIEGGEIQNEGAIIQQGRGRRKKVQKMPLESGEAHIEAQKNVEPVEVFEAEVDGLENLEPTEVCEVQVDDKENLEQTEVCEVLVDDKENLEQTEVCEVLVDGKGNMIAGDESLKNSEVQICNQEMAKATMAASVKVTRGRKNAANLELDCGETVYESKLTRKGRGRKKKLHEMPQQSSEVRVEMEENLEPREVSKNCDIEVDGEKKLKPEKTAEGGIVKESCDNVEVEADNGVEDQKVDLEKMTLGKWFDFMEVYLRKQIVDSTEEMIDEMRRKADRVLQYMIAEKKKMGKL